MRQFAATGFRIWNLSREAKLVYTLFGVFSLAALATSALFYEDLVGSGTDGIRGYYAGEAPSTTASPVGKSAPSGGPEIALPDESPSAGRAPTARSLTVAVTYRKLLEVTHFHLFTVPVFLLIVSHLFMLTGLRPSVKTAWIAATWLSAALHLAAPWLVRYGGGGWAPLYAGSGVLLGVTSLVLTAHPIGAMWLPRPSRPRPGDEPPSAGSTSIS
jgi:hypothetical protein